MDPKESALKVAQGSREAAKKYALEFREFLMKTNMFSMAMGVVIGTAIGTVVSSIVSDVVMPLVGVFQHNGEWRAIKWGYGKLQFTVGHLAGALLDFAIIATIVFLITKVFVRQAPPPPTKQCKMCLEQIHPDAKRCKFCTSEA
jgi:large conductance mechanosensitive channel